MSTMYITEYSRIAGDADGHVIQAGKHDEYDVDQKQTFTTTAGVSAAFGAKTHFIRVVCDGAGYLAFGATPTAVTLTGTPVQANTPEFFGVEPGQKISAVTQRINNTAIMARTPTTGP